jgi:tetratricopeptide (TPR) repeat protein
MALGAGPLFARLSVVDLMRLPLALAMIVKDEAENLPVSLGSVRDLCRQMVVVDTGSSDGTEAVAADLGAEVYHWTWQNDFAAARNFALEQVREPWVLVLDADEELAPVEADQNRLAEAVLNPSAYAYNLRVVSLLGDGSEVSEAYVTRLFRHRPDIRYEGAVHEQILPSLHRSGLRMDRLDVRIIHTGYLSEVIARRGKLDRNRRLLLAELEQRPEDHYVHFQLGQCYLGLNEGDLAVAAFEAALHWAPLGQELRPVYYLGLARAHLQAGRPQRALRVVREGLWHYPDYTDLEFLRGQIWLTLGRLADARTAFLRCLDLGSAHEQYLMSDVGAGSYQAKLALADVARQEEAFAESLAYALSALRDQPRWIRAWLFIEDLTRGTPAPVLLRHLSLVLGPEDLVRILSTVPGLPPIYDEIRRLIMA